jgi:hypothetical protein
MVSGFQKRGGRQKVMAPTLPDPQMQHFDVYAQY